MYASLTADAAATAWRLTVLKSSAVFGAVNVDE
jgi:hypothetical protein